MKEKEEKTQRAILIGAGNRGMTAYGNFCC